MQETDRRIAAIDLNGKCLIDDCKTIILFLKEKLGELKQDILSHPFTDEEEEINFFKHQKPMLLGRLMYFYTVLHIESYCPPCRELADDYYRKSRKNRSCSSTAASASTSITVAVRRTVTITISCVRKRKSARKRKCTSLTRNRSSLRVMTG